MMPCTFRPIIQTSSELNLTTCTESQHEYVLCHFDYGRDVNAPTIRCRMTPKYAITISSDSIYSGDLYRGVIVGHQTMCTRSPIWRNVQNCDQCMLQWAIIRRRDVPRNRYTRIFDPEYRMIPLMIATLHALRPKFSPTPCTSTAANNTNPKINFRTLLTSGSERAMHVHMRKNSHLYIRYAYITCQVNTLDSAVLKQEYARGKK